MALLQRRSHLPTTRPIAQPDVRQRLGLLLVLLALSLGACKPQHATPGEAEFNVANQQLFAHEGSAAFGDSPDAIALAQAFSTKLSELTSAAEPEGRKGPAEPGTNGKVVCYCHIGDDKLVFLVRPPVLEKLKRDEREALLERAWKAAEQVAAEPGKTREVAVGMRGMWVFSAIAQGKLGTPPKMLVGNGVSSRSLYPFFAAPSTAKK